MIYIVFLIKQVQENAINGVAKVQNEVVQVVKNQHYFKKITIDLIVNVIDDFLVNIKILVEIFIVMCVYILDVNILPNFKRTNRE